MTIQSTNTPFGYTIFCDDIRQETTGKVSLIGVYSGVMFLATDTFPIMLPKLAMRIRYAERPGESAEPVELRIYFPGDADDAPSYRHVLPFERTPPPADALPDSLIGVAHHLEFSPILLKEEGAIKVRAYRGDLEIKLGSLRIKKLSMPQSA